MNKNRGLTPLAAVLMFLVVYFLQDVTTETSKKVSKAHLRWVLSR